MSYTYTMNGLKRRALTWRVTMGGNTSATEDGVIAVDGTEFVAKAFIYSQASVQTRCVNILGYNPAVYLSADSTALSQDDYALPDDANSISYKVQEQGLIDDDGVSTIFYAYFTNETDEDITFNKVLITGYIGAQSNSAGYECLLFEELLDEPITLAPGERFARNYEFRLEVA